MQQIAKKGQTQLSKVGSREEKGKKGKQPQPPQVQIQGSEPNPAGIPGSRATGSQLLGQTLPETGPPTPFAHVHCSSNDD